MTESRRRTASDVARRVLEIEARAVADLARHLDGGFERAVDELSRCAGRVVCTGMGKSGLIMKKVAATLSSTGSPAFFLHPAEAIHGDLGMIAAGDVVLAASYSGGTEELVRLIEMVRRLGVPMIALTGNTKSQLAQNADIHIHVPIDQEACPLNLAPTASTTATLAMGDALAMALSEAKGFTSADFRLLHPGGNLGKRLLEIRELMHSGDRLPAVAIDTPMREVIYEMSRKQLGITGVLDAEGRLVGCISDGDLRRLLERDANPLDRTAGECISGAPHTITASELAPVALHKMEEHRITSLFVVDSENRLEGVVHLHDLWRLEMF